MVIMNMNDYLAEGYRQLSDTQFYQKVDEDLTQKHNERVEMTVRDI